MFKLTILLAPIVFMSLGCPYGSRINNLDEASKELQAVLDEYVASSGHIHGAMLYVEVPSVNLSWQGTAGLDDIQNKTALLPDQPFRIASVTKTFVAATVLRLVEEDVLRLGDPVASLISKEHREILAQDQYDLEAITISQLLSHTSGLFDYALGNSSYPGMVSSQPQFRWSRTDQLKAAVDFGDPVGKPGTVFHYSDTGYILLGEIIEFVTSTSLAETMRTLLDYEALGLKYTWMESIEPVPQGALSRVHQYLQDTDTYQWDPSMDLYGGGGLVSTTAELARFYRGLFSGKVYTSLNTLDVMLTQPEVPASPANSSVGVVHFESPVPTDYRFGIEVIELLGVEAYIHTGFWGVLVAYIPTYDAAIAIHVPNGYPGDYILKKSVLIIKELIRYHQPEANVEIDINDSAR